MLDVDKSGGTDMAEKERETTCYTHAVHAVQRRCCLFRDFPGQVPT